MQTYCTMSIVPGEKITAYTNTFPARRYWYRHDKVIVDGVELHGHIQVRERFGRIETMTCYDNSCVIGRQVDWLIRQQG